jgi:hypothetical protein
MKTFIIILILLNNCYANLPVPHAKIPKTAASKTTQAITAAASVSTSGVALGFAGSIDLDIDGTKSQTTSQSTSSRGSSIQANNINIATGKDSDQQVLIQGSDLVAKNAINVDTEKKVPVTHLNFFLKNTKTLS